MGMVISPCCVLGSSDRAERAAWTVGSKVDVHDHYYQEQSWVPGTITKVAGDRVWVTAQRSTGGTFTIRGIDRFWTDSIRPSTFDSGESDVDADLSDLELENDFDEEVVYPSLTPRRRLKELQKLIRQDVLHV